MNKSRHPYQNRVFSRLRGKAVLVHPGLKEIIGSVNAAIWLSQILYWYGKGVKPGEIYKSRSQLEKETGLTRDQQIRVENHLKKLAVVTIIVKPGRPSPVNHIAINFDVLEQLICNIRGISILDERKTVRNNTLTSSFPNHQSTQNTENIPEITQKNIQKGEYESMNEDGPGHQECLERVRKMKDRLLNK